jgi:tRNA threonylcarbamoyl adenosine modification protein YeaZ
VLLALETATDRVSVALHDGTSLLAHTHENAPRRHVEALLPLIDRTLRDADTTVAALTAVAVGVGPGAFTGLRVGIATATSLAAARSLPCVGVSSLDAVAHQARTDGSVGADATVVVALDARRREVFWARYVDGRRAQGPEVGDPRALASGPAEGVAVVGDAVLAFPGVFPGGIAAWPDAAAVAAIALGDSPFGTVEPRPVYVRRPDAAAPTAPKSVLPGTA